MSLPRASLVVVNERLSRQGAEGASLKADVNDADTAAIAAAASLATCKGSISTTLQALMDTTPTLPNLRTGVDTALAAIAAA